MVPEVRGLRLAMVLLSGVEFLMRGIQRTRRARAGAGRRRAERGDGALARTIPPEGPCPEALVPVG